MKKPWYSQNALLLIGILLLAGLIYSFTSSSSLSSKNNTDKSSNTMHNETLTQPQFNDSITPIIKTEEQWKSELSSQQYYVLREKGTERPFTGKYWDSKTEGVYECAGCNNALFSSTTKFKSGTGWPSYYQPVSNTSVKEIIDRSHGMTRTEVVCARCEGHLGHIFNDGPKPTGLRYCINSAALELNEK